MEERQLDLDASWLRHASPYINQHRGCTFVVLLDGDVLEHSNGVTLLQDIVLLHSLGVRIVLVHGARPQINLELEAQGIRSTFRNGRRITTREEMPSIAKVVGLKRLSIEAKLTTDMPASPMRGAKVRVISGNFILAQPIGVEGGVDYAYSGSVRKVDVDGITQLLDTAHLVLISHVGFSRTGEMFNLACEEVAASVAIALKADKLITFSKNDGLVSDGSLIKHMSPSQCRSLFERGQGQVSANLLQSLAHAASSGVSRAHVVSYSRDGALLNELFTRDGAGTLITEEEQETLRKAKVGDAGRLLHILRPLEANGALVKRSRKQLEREMNRFLVLEKENLLIGCVALYPFADTKTAELVCLAVRTQYRNGGRGKRLLNALEDEARTRGIETIYALTTKTAHWFLEHGFVEIDAMNLPADRAKLYNFQRNSKVFRKNIL